MNIVKGNGRFQNYNAQGDEPAFVQLHLVYRLLIFFLFFLFLLTSILSVFVFVSFFVFLYYVC